MKDYKSCTAKKQINKDLVTNAMSFLTIATVITMVLFEVPVQL